MKKRQILKIVKKAELLMSGMNQKVFRRAGSWKGGRRLMQIASRTRDHYRIGRQNMDDLTKKRPQDANKINLHERWEVEYWTKELGVSETKLRAAVLAVGVMVTAVKAWLKTH